MEARSTNECASRNARTWVVPRRCAVPRAGRRFCVRRRRSGDGDGAAVAVQGGRIGIRPARARAQRARPMGARALVRRAPAQERRRTALLVHRWPDHREHRGHGRPPRLGTHLQGSLPALQGDAGLRPALAERLRLPGSVGRGPGRARAQPEQQARHRVVRHRQVLARLPRARGSQRRRDHQAGHTARPMDGLGQLLLHLHRQQQLAHLERAEAVSREGLAVQGPPGHAVVRALRDGAVRARDDRLIQGDDAHLPVRALPGAPRGQGDRPREAACVVPRLDHDALDIADECDARGPPGPRLREGPRSGRWRAGARGPHPRSEGLRGVEVAQRRGAGDGEGTRPSRSALRGSLRRPSARVEVRTVPQGHRVG